MRASDCLCKMGHFDLNVEIIDVRPSLQVRLILELEGNRGESIII